MPQPNSSHTGKLFERASYTVPNGCCRFTGLAQHEPEEAHTGETRSGDQGRKNEGTSTTTGDRESECRGPPDEEPQPGTTRSGNSEDHQGAAEDTTGDRESVGSCRTSERLHPGTTRKSSSERSRGATNHTTGDRESVGVDTSGGGVGPARLAATGLAHHSTAGDQRGADGSNRTNLH